MSCSFASLHSWAHGVAHLAGVYDHNRWTRGVRLDALWAAGGFGMCAAYSRTRLGMIYLRTSASHTPAFGYGLWHDDFWIAPKEWLPGTDFGFDDPPTPWEFAATYSAQANALYRGTDKCAFAALRLWAIGIPLGALQEAIAPDIIPRMAGVVSHFMTRPLFILWALGTDLTPAMPPTLVGRDLPEHRRAMFVNHPYIRSQLDNGHRINPVPRPLRTPNLLFRNRQHKALFYANKPTSFRANRKSLWGIKGFPESTPEWASYSLLW